MSELRSDRRDFLRAAGAVAAVVAVDACAPKDGAVSATVAAADADGIVTSRDVGFDRATLDALGDVILPGDIGAGGRRAAVTAFVSWISAYAPVAEEMHGYGYADIRHLPADPAPAWREQLDALNASAKSAHQVTFAAATPKDRTALVTAVLAAEKGEHLPAPLAAKHVAVALLSHWASSPDGWDVGFKARIRRDSCRVLDDSPRKPLPLAPQRLAT
jgi:hypothetical protein